MGGKGEKGKGVTKPSFPDDAIQATVGLVFSFFFSCCRSEEFFDSLPNEEKKEIIWNFLTN